MSHQLHFAEHTLQELALIFMGLVYTVRLLWLLHWKAGKERQPHTGDPAKTPQKGILYSWCMIGMPWAMESTRTKLFLYAQFVVFHLGVVAAIAQSFVIPYGPTLLTGYPWLVTAMQVSIGAACLVGLLRIVRRVGSPYLRAISSPDDYFSLLLLTVWFAFAFLAAPNDLSGGETVALVYFGMTAFFLVYVPFSKISHYLYYPFTRYYFGKTMGRRGVYPLLRSSSPSSEP
jgi:nitrate reductase gamma subunit